MDRARPGCIGPRGTWPALQETAVENLATDPEVADDVSLESQLLWLQLARREWRSMAVVPVDATAASRPLTLALPRVALPHGARLELLDGTGVTLADGTRLAGELGQSVASGLRVVVAVDPLEVNAAMIPLVVQVDAAVVVLRLGTSSFASAQRTIDLIGRDKVLGFVALEDGPGPA